MLDTALTVILAGGTGTRLHPLTADRAKPAVPFGGKYRVIDFCLANCLHSGLRRVLVLTQYKSLSLQKHLRDGWSIFNPELGEFITTVPPQMRTGARWYEGTADAIFQNMYLLERSGADQVLILSGDHIYRMDYAAMLTHHEATGAELTVACMEVPLAQAGTFGVVTLDHDGRIISFLEKPAQPQPMADNQHSALASMGIYVFSMDLLREALAADQARGDSSHDFGRDVLPRLLDSHRVQAYMFGGPQGRVTPDRYWRDVGTIDSYYAANMDLLRPIPPLNLYQDNWPIRTYQNQTPPARTVPGESGTEGICINSIVSGGVVIAGGSVQHSILFSQVSVGDEAFVESSILFQGVQVGAGARLNRCIIDKHVSVPPGESVGHDLQRDLERFLVTDGGIVVVPKGYRFP
jgi:glucose-1-phosphate adenylyltransferase